MPSTQSPIKKLHLDQCCICLHMRQKLYKKPCQCQDLVHNQCLSKMILKKLENNPEQIRSDYKSRNQESKESEQKMSTECEKCQQLIYFAIQQKYQCRKCSEYENQKAILVVLTISIIVTLIIIGFLVGYGIALLNQEDQSDSVGVYLLVLAGIFFIPFVLTCIILIKNMVIKKILINFDPLLVLAQQENL